MPLRFKKSLHSIPSGETKHGGEWISFLTKRDSQTVEAGCPMRLIIER